MQVWSCFHCTYDNPTNQARCVLCEKPRPSVTLNPCLAPLMTPLRAMGNALGLRCFEVSTSEAHLLWFLVQALESGLPQPFEWAARCRPSAPDEPYMLMATTSGAPFEDANHMHLIELRQRAQQLQQRMAGLSGGRRPDFADAFTSPQWGAPLYDSPRSSSADGTESASSSWRGGGSDYPGSSRGGLDSERAVVEGLAQMGLSQVRPCTARTSTPTRPSPSPQPSPQPQP